ncbi:hypothetical protein [Colwellia psychrerythraea]|uniref:Bacteriophage CI repressor n=1 Tax=Colwellia psychrerythraea TaxID=28229 RepID=A0A099K912_COLPS|nr:hypothetical protein [Colwellia psychrerythraea]KGJ86856.1 hypothetical protein GAB14E_4683 [Colwellia psychrerythraea]
MLLNSNEIFSRLLELFKTNKVNELSILLGYTDSWGASTKKRGGIPFEACVIASIKFDVSMDYILFGKEKSSIDINVLKMSITEGIFAAMQSDMITLSKDVKISTMANMITSEIVENCDIKTSDEIKKAI